MGDGTWDDLETLKSKAAAHKATLKQTQAQLKALALVAKYEAALRHIIGMAGYPDATQACRNIINRAKEALGEK